MKLSLQTKNTRTLVITGYCLLVALAIIGIVTIYLEVIKSHRQNTDNNTFKDELINLSNTLTTMYQAEETASLLAYIENDNLRQEYDSLTNRVFEQIDSLRLISSDQTISQGLDSLSTLLVEKRKYALEMFELMKYINKNVVSESEKRTTITHADIDKLNALLANVTKVKGDTVHTVAEKKGFFKRVGAIFKSNSQDTVTHISNGSVSETKELAVPLVSDTIVEFFKDINKNAQLRNAQLIKQLVTHQQELYTIKELTGFQINRIMNTIKEKEFQANLDLLKEKNDSLRRSSLIVAIIGLLALIVVVFFMSWILHSLNEAQRLQNHIQEANEHAEALLKSREQLIYMITHDIKAPLSSIIGFLDLVSEDSLSQKQQYYVGNMHTSASHIMDLVRSLLDFHSIEKNQFQLTTVAFSPASLIRNIYESFLPLAQKKKLKFNLNSTLPETKAFLSDPYYIREIVNNLLSNAVKFTPEQGKVTLVTSLEADNQWKISVHDNGPGVATEDQSKIFEEFFRSDKTKEEKEGTGLGLPISRKLATVLGGTIDIESQKGQGSTFILSIPLNPVAENTVYQPDETQSPSSGRILIVDDDRIQLALLSELMKKEGLPCICCLSAYEALDILQEKTIDIVFTDIHIPDMEGFELVKRIRESGFPQAAVLPVFACSADCQKSESELKAAGFTGYLPKPCKVDQLMETIEKYTSLKRNTDKIYSQSDELGWQTILKFLPDDQEAAMKIVDSFIEETNKNKELLKIAFQEKDKEVVKNISHKMLSLMRMVSAQEIVSLLTECETGILPEEKQTSLLHLLEEKIKEAENKRLEITHNS
jgi:signal transduction histidine kinase/CheY-like chemotaxis protein